MNEFVDPGFPLQDSKAHEQYLADGVLAAPMGGRIAVNFTDWSAMITQTPPLTTDRPNGQPGIRHTDVDQPLPLVDRPLRVTARRANAGVPHAAASRGLAQMFGLDTRAAILAVLVDLMVFAGDTFSLETLVPLGIAIAAVLGVIVYKIQRTWYNDDRDSAFIKAMIIGLLTAIPVPITPLIAIPSGILGFLTTNAGKQNRES